MDQSIHPDPQPRWINKSTGEIAREIREEQRSQWLHVTFVRDDPNNREQINSYFGFEDGETPPTTWTVYFDGITPGWLMEALGASHFPYTCGFQLYRDEPQFQDIDACADALALVAAVESDLLPGVKWETQSGVPVLKRDGQPSEAAQRPISMQSHITNAIVAAIQQQRQGITAVVSAEFSNRGAIYAMRGLTSLLEIRYDFQSDYCKLDIKRVDRQTLTSALIRYNEGEKLTSLIDTVRKAVAERA